MRLVIDASAALAAFSGPAGEAAVRAHQLVGPPLLWSEAAAELHAALQRGEISRTTAEAALDALDRAVECHEDRRLHRRAWELADSLGWGRTYDAEYVATALDLGLPLLTLDARLARGIGHLLRVLNPADLGAS